VPKTDPDGNDIAGIRLPELTVPLATYTGWGLRRGAWANDGCEASGQYIPFPKTQTDRVNTNDPRLSVGERYASFADYRTKVINAIDDLVQRRFLLCEDTQPMAARLLQAGPPAGVPAPTASDSTTPPNPLPACMPNQPPRRGNQTFDDGNGPDYAPGRN
jgi:hypothetical protein